MNQLTREDCIEMLQKKYEELKAQAEANKYNLGVKYMGEVASTE